MKKIILFFVAFFVAFNVMSQNIQTHYDMGKDRGYLTTTVEMFKPDSLGNTYFFIDMDYGVAGVEGIGMAYWEIARAFTLGKSPFAAHIEYNGGFGQYFPGLAYQINDAYLGGVEYSWNAKDFSRGFTIQTLFKTIRGKNNTSFQLTGVWYLNLCKDKISLSGFADFWKEDNIFADGSTTKFVFLSEPQFWYNFNKNISAGSEVELGYNFTGNYTKGFHVCPTAALRYTF